MDSKSWLITGKIFLKSTSIPTYRKRLGVEDKLVMQKTMMKRPSQFVTARFI